MSSDLKPVKKTSQKSAAQPINANDVAEYLKAHPDFFLNRDQLLAELQLPHESGKAISLLERQVHILRDRSIESRHRLNDLLENARYNDQLFHVTRSLILTLLEEQEISQITSVTEANLATQPGIDACALVLVDARLVPHERPAYAGAADEMQHHFPSLFSKQHVVCQSVDREAAKILFPEHSGKVRSVALCPVTNHDRLIAVLALGNHSRDYFNQDLDTLFLEFIADVLGSIIAKVSP